MPECLFSLVHAGKGRPASSSKSTSSSRSYDSEDVEGASPFRFEKVEEQAGGGYLLVSVRRYRLQCSDARWAGRTLRLSLVFLDNGQPVPPLDGAAGPLLAFPTTAGPYGLPVATVSLKLDAAGVSTASFGIGASTYRHQGRPFRLLIADEAGAPVGDRMPVRTVAHLPAASKSRERAPSLAPSPPRSPRPRPRRPARPPPPLSPPPSEPPSPPQSESSSSERSCSLADLAAVACAAAVREAGPPAKRPRPAFEHYRLAFAPLPHAYGLGPSIPVFSAAP